MKIGGFELLRRFVPTSFSANLLSFHAYGMLRELEEFCL